MCLIPNSYVNEAEIVLYFTISMWKDNEKTATKAASQETEAFIHFLEKRFFFKREDILVTKRTVKTCINSVSYLSIQT